MELKKLKLKELKEIGKKLKFKDVGERSGISLRQELQHLARIFIAGQVQLPLYDASRGQLLPHLSPTDKFN